jgi:steroid delta-isomerase-like uncharacterized protein
MNQSTATDQGTEQRPAMTRDEMDQLIGQHIAAEMAGDTSGAVSMYTDDVIHDDVGSPTGPLHGPQAAKGFYDTLTANLKTERMDVNHAWYGDSFCVMEHELTGIVVGDLLGIPGGGRRITFRLLHVWEFRDGLMSRENTWLDTAAIVAQLTA